MPIARFAAEGALEETAMFMFRRTLAVLAMVFLGTLIVAVEPAGAEPVGTSPGYWLAGADGGVFSFGAPFFGSGSSPPGPCTFSPQPPSTLDGAFGCAAIAATPGGNGYWLLNMSRFPTAFGAAAPPNQVGCTGLNGATGAWTGLASSPTGNGFFMVSSNGAVVGCGDAVPVGGLDSKMLDAPVVGIAATSDGKGYWLVASDGGVFAFGDAGFNGSLGGAHLNAPVVALAATPDGKGYWLVAADGGVFTFGDAAFSGSMGGTALNAPVVGMATTPDGTGYWLAAADGGVFSFGSAPFEGSMAGKPMVAPVVGIASRSGAMSG
jgi:hypothetical protein